VDHIDVKSSEDGTVFQCNLLVDGDRIEGPVKVQTPEGQTLK